MAYEGELVKMENGRWTRFQRCPVVNVQPSLEEDASILVAVELDEHYQDLLNAAVTSLEGYHKRGIPVQLRLDPDSEGKLSLRFLPSEEGAVALH